VNTKKETPLLFGTIITIPSYSENTIKGSKKPSIKLVLKNRIRKSLYQVHPSVHCITITVKEEKRNVKGV
jgi:hypothetical protein